MTQEWGGATHRQDCAPMLTTVGAAWTIGEFLPIVLVRISPDPAVLLFVGKPNEPKEPAAHQSDSLAWLAANSRQLSERYGDQWLLVERNEVLAASRDPTELERLAKRHGIETPYITQAASPSKGWRTAYGDSRFVR